MYNDSILDTTYYFFNYRSIQGTAFPCLYISYIFIEYDS